MTASVAPVEAGYDNDAALLARVPRCYKVHCRYLTSMTLTVRGAAIRGQGELGIGQSCYLDGTGHLDSVEVNSSFHWPVNPRRFYGEFELTRAMQRRLRPDAAPLICLDTAFRCWDDGNGQSSGEVRVAIVGT